LAINNPQSSAALFVLSADSSDGESPPYSDLKYPVTCVEKGNQLHYILFPPSDMCELADVPYNTPKYMVAESDSLLRVDVKQSKANDFIDYYFDNRMRVVSAHPCDNFTMHHKALVAEGKLLPIDSQYFAHLRDTITYWTDSGWVTEGQLRAVEKSSK